VTTGNFLCGDPMEDNEKTFDPPAAPILPDGIGLTHDQVAELLVLQCKLEVSPDDPMMMMVTLLNAYLHEQDKLLQRHNQALTSILSARTDGYVQAVEQVSNDLKTSLASSTVEGIQSTYKQFRISSIWLAGIIGVSALVNVTVFVLQAVSR